MEADELLRNWCEAICKSENWAEYCYIVSLFIEELLNHNCD